MDVTGAVYVRLCVLMEPYTWIMRTKRIHVTFVPADWNNLETDGGFERAFDRRKKDLPPIKGIL